MASQLLTEESRTALADLLRRTAQGIEKGETIGIFIATIQQEEGGAVAAATTEEVETELGQLAAVACEDNGWRTPWDDGW